MFGRIRPYSHVNQDFIWMGEYVNGTSLLEFDLETKQPNSFYHLQRDRLIRYGLIGHGITPYFEVFGGCFKIHGHMVEVAYQEGEEEYSLTGQPQMYNDIISYKDAESTFIPQGKDRGTAVNQIVQYNVGYKTNLDIKGVKFGFKAICSIPFNQPAYLHFRLVADKELNGKLVIKKDGWIAAEFDAPLKPDVGGELNWVVR